MRWLLFFLLAGCPSEPPPACITVDTNCAELYVPIFDNVYTNTISKSCGASDSSCHSSPGQRGLSFVNEDTAYAGLTKSRVKPGDPGCSLFIVRTDSPGKDYQMPPGTPLAATERCSLIHWVQNGAKAGSAM